jgi:hypothetical protein
LAAVLRDSSPAITEAISRLGVVGGILADGHVADSEVDVLQIAVENDWTPSLST